jgi:hypothetical protein
VQFSLAIGGRKVADSAQQDGHGARVSGSSHQSHKWLLPPGSHGGQGR